jgi:hypothetical protein
LNGLTLFIFFTESGVTYERIGQPHHWLQED